jgi:hypothetical protein
MERVLDRQSFLGENSEEILRQTTAVRAGLGGGGSHVVQQLTHLGVGNFVLIDPDRIEFPNLNRTVGATYQDAVLGTRKVEVAARMIRAINPYARVLPIIGLWQENLESIRTGDIMFGCIEGFSVKVQLERVCRAALVPLIDIGMDVHVAQPYTISGQVVLSMPGCPCFLCMGHIRETDCALDEQKYGHAGGTPQVVWSNGLLASAAVGIMVQLLTPWSKASTAAFLGYDGDRTNLDCDSRIRSRILAKCPHYTDLNSVGDPFWAG